MFIDLVEMDRTKQQSFCWDDGGAQLWKEEEPCFQSINENMVQEAQIIRANTLVVGCPFCMIVHTEAGKDL